MPKKNYKDIPADYAVCQHANCPVSERCLHHFAYNELLKKETYLHLLNPERCSKGEECEFFRDKTPALYARGFTNFQKRMLPDQYKEFMCLLIGKFSRNPYYERRRGETTLSPNEQKIVLDALKQVGVTEEMQFDSYEQTYNCYD